MDKKLVVPGDFLSDDVKLADEGTYVENGKVFSSVFGIASLKNKIRVVPLSGKYIPRTGDVIIGMITEVTFSNWIVDIRSPYEGLLHISEYLRRIENTEMSKYLDVGDLILTIVKDVSPNMKIELTLNDQRARTIKDGRTIEITPSKVPRVIGRSGSMITLLKNETNCNIFVAQNGRIWITGKDKDIDFASRALLKIENESHISGLTNRITQYLKEEKGEKVVEKKETKANEPTPEPEKIEEEQIKSEKTKKTLDNPENNKEENNGGILDELLR